MSRSAFVAMPVTLAKLSEYAAAPEVNGLPPYGQRKKKAGKPGGAHSGVDEMGFSTAWRSYDAGSLSGRRP